MTPLLLDTCAVISLVEEEPISEEAIAALNEALDADLPVYVSVMTSWEVGLLVALKRLPLSMDPLSWFERLLVVPGVSLFGATPRILVGSSFLPGRPPRDPIDRIILASAREGGFRLVTRDKQLLDYAKDGYVQAVPC